MINHFIYFKFQIFLIILNLNYLTFLIDQYHQQMIYFNLKLMDIQKYDENKIFKVFQMLIKDIIHVLLQYILDLILIY